MAAGGDVLADAFTDHVRQKVMYNIGFCVSQCNNSLHDEHSLHANV